MKTTLTEGATTAIQNQLKAANQSFAQRCPGESSRRQPVHTVYGGAHLFKAEAAQKLGKVALATLEQYAPDFMAFAHATGLPSEPWLAHAIHARVAEKLKKEPVEDF